jgi:hypothetical protein
MRRLIVVIIIILMCISCSESITGPTSKLEQIEIYYPKNNIEIVVEARNDTIVADWELIEGCSQYTAILHYDSTEVANPDSVSIFKNEFHTAPSRSVQSHTQEIFSGNNRQLLIVHPADFENLGDTIKVFWKIKCEYTNWSDIESFYVIKK